MSAGLAGFAFHTAHVIEEDAAAGCQRVIGVLIDAAAAAAAAGLILTAKVGIGSL